MDEQLASQTSAEIQRLQAEHQRYASRLEALLTKPYLSAEEQLEEVRLKKMKLHTKDLISAIQHRAVAVDHHIPDHRIADHRVPASA